MSSIFQISHGMCSKLVPDEENLTPFWAEGRETPRSGLLVLSLMEEEEGREKWN